MKKPTSSHYAGFIELGKPVNGYGVGRVLKSKDDKYKEGDIVSSPLFAWQEKQILTTNSMWKVPDLKGIPLSYNIGCLGMPGVTAIKGLLEIGQPKSGETVLVSGAAGAVGSLVGQIAKIQGCYVVGVAGGAEKCQKLKEWGFDDTIDYKEEKDLVAAVKRTCPKGVDVYFDNVGGETQDAAFLNLNEFGRVVLCGAISQYNEGKPPQGPRLLPLLIGKSGRAEGYIVSKRFPVDTWPAAIGQLAQWVLGK
jgi:NADPH-dependent curcumin reductase CurA